MSTSKELGFLYPFGEMSCEQELEVLQEHYNEYFYDQSPYNKEALNPETYLIVGRRGSGKTSLSKFFGFQKYIKNAISIDVDEQDIYDHILPRIASRHYPSTDLAINDVRKVWEYLIWSLIFDNFSDYDPAIKDASVMLSKRGKKTQFFHDVIKTVMSRYLDESGVIANELIEMITGPVFKIARERVLEHTPKRPVIIAIDTFERYDRDNVAMMAMIASLIQCASDFNISCARKGIHVKVFVPAEIFPYIKESVIPNTIKFIRDPLYLNWKPKDLTRLICWRLHKSLSDGGHPFPFKSVDWKNFDEVQGKLWDPFFGKTILNLRGKEELSFPYILRHTQMRPRQLVLLCRGMARAAAGAEKFPYFKEISIPESLVISDTLLADEVLNSYELIYPRAAEIITALTAAPTVFEGKYLDQVAKRTSSRWPAGNYSASEFRRLVAELGIVGRVRHKDEKTSIIEADFEYNMHDRLTLNSDDLCVIHPMFYYKLQVKKDGDWIVYPFPNHPDYNDLR